MRIVFFSVCWLVSHQMSDQSQEMAEQYLLWSDNLSGHILVLISSSGIPLHTDPTLVIGFRSFATLIKLSRDSQINAFRYAIVDIMWISGSLSSCTLTRPLG